jgi:hypothetical protein
MAQKELGAARGRRRKKGNIAPLRLDEKREGGARKKKAKLSLRQEGGRDSQS